ncbi:MAG: diaminopimelate epimerase [Pseudobdellovibrio sp.]
MKINTFLLSGAGNTFHIINDLNENSTLNESQKKKLTRKICKLNPADGVIFLQAEKNKSGQYKWGFFNNDGSDAEMCGNATRCVGFYLKNILNDKNNEWLLSTRAGLITIKALPDLETSKNLFLVRMTAIIELQSKLGFYCNTGVPHLVLEIKDINKCKNFEESAKKLRNHPDFFPAGTNVTYVQRLDEINKIKAISFERGVEGFTAACGTGAMAAAFYNLKIQHCNKTYVEMPGGTLMMDVSNLNEPIMVGPAITLGKFEYEI